MKESNIDEVIKDLKVVYEKARKSDYVRTPIPYALYKVWRKYDSIAKKQSKRITEVK